MAPKRIRTREGTCFPCKERRVLCDLRKPSCAKCIAAGKVCEYGTIRLRWDNGVASRGRLAGQSVPIVSTQSLMRANTRPAEWHIKYFAEEVLSLFSLSEKPLNVDLSVFADDSALYEVVKAVSSSHQMYKGGARSGDALVTARQARGSAIVAFHRSLNSRELNSLAAVLFSANVFLCILDGMVDPWADATPVTFTHYRGGCAMLKAWDPRKDPVASKSGTLSRIISIFATMDVSYAVLSGNEPFFDREWWNFFIGKEAWWTGIHDDKPFIEIMGIFAEMARLKNAYLLQGEPIPIEHLLSLQLRLQEPEKQYQQQQQQQAPLENGTTNTEGSDAFILCYRMAALIYMYRALCNLETDNPLVQQCVNAGLGAMTGEGPSSQFAHCQIFPGLIIGAHCLQQSQRHSIQHMMDGARVLLFFGSVGFMHDFLNGLWRSGNHNLDWTTLFQPIAHVAFLF